MQTLEFRKYVILGGSGQHGLQIRIQRKNLRISAPDEILAFF